MLSSRSYGVYGHHGTELEGFTKDKFNYTAGQWEHDRMVKLVDMVTKVAGRDVDVAADVHTRLDVPSAIRLARDLEPYHLMWLEEPVSAENVKAMGFRDLYRATSAGYHHARYPQVWRPHSWAATGTDG